MSLSRRELIGAAVSLPLIRPVPATARPPGVGADNSLLSLVDPFIGTDLHQGQEGLIGQYAHGNEPSHHVAWLYALSDRPQRGPELVRQIARQFYADTPGGITGNDDCGQMTAWYILATLGFYPADAMTGRW